jgi:two-component system cell cycle response regulator DivK
MNEPASFADVTDRMILIVEDDDNSRMLARDVLQATGYRTAEAETAEEGLRLAREINPHLILMDIQLPGMSGLDALRHLRTDPATRDIPVMAVTASAMSHDRPRIMAAGFDGYQTKPISVKDFLDAVRTLLVGPPAQGTS